MCDHGERVLQLHSLTDVILIHTSQEHLRHVSTAMLSFSAYRCVNALMLLAGSP